MAREWLSTPLSPRHKTASPWNGTSAAIGGLFVLFGVKTPTFVLKCSLPFFFFRPFPPPSLAGGLLKAGAKKTRRFARSA